MAKLEAFISGAWRTPKRAEYLIGGTWRNITRGEVYRGGAWSPIASFVPPLSLSVSPDYVEGRVTTSRPSRTTVVSNFTQATPTGGTAPYSYQWSILSGGASITSPNMARTTFSQSLASEQDSTGTARVICTDSQGKTAFGDVAYYLYNTSLQ